MSRIIETTVYAFDELSDKAKEKARECFREGNAGETFWAESVIEDAVRMGEMLGIEFSTHAVTLMNKSIRHDPSIYWQLGYCQSDYAGFDGSYSFAPAAVAKITDETGGNDTVLIRIAAELSRIQNLCGDTLTATIKHSDYYGLQIECEAFADNDEPADLPAGVEKDLREAFKDFCNWIYDSLRKENEYQNADEQVDDNIRANEYEFTVDGKIA